MHQQGENELAQHFREILAHLRNDAVTDADIEFLNTCILANLSPEE